MEISFRKCGEHLGQASTGYRHRRRDSCWAQMGAALEQRKTPNPPQGSPRHQRGQNKTACASPRCRTLPAPMPKNCKATVGRFSSEARNIATPPTAANKGGRSASVRHSSLSQLASRRVVSRAPRMRRHCEDTLDPSFITLVAPNTAVTGHGDKGLAHAARCIGACATGRRKLSPGTLWEAGRAGRR